MRILVALLSVLVLLQSTRAQSTYSIQGKVSNQQGEPIPGASVVLLNGVKGTVTDGTGAFALLVTKSGTYTLAVSSIAGERHSRNCFNTTKHHPCPILAGIG
jgi:hypothetical protein